MARGPDGKKNKKEWIEYYLPDGTLLGIWGDNRYCGYWEISGPVMCIGYGGVGDYCRVYALDGTAITRFKLDGTLKPTEKLLQGNPESL